MDIEIKRSGLWLSNTKVPSSRFFAQTTKKHVSASKNNLAIETQFYPMILNTEKKCTLTKKIKSGKKDGCLATLGPPPIGFQLI